MRNRRSRRAMIQPDGGCTLIELLIVVLIVGILSAVAVPVYLGYTNDARNGRGQGARGLSLDRVASRGPVLARDRADTFNAAA